MNIEQDRWLFHKGDIIHFNVPENISLPIYVIGDSHVRILTEAAPYIFKSSQVDIEDVFISKTAYAIGEEKYLNDAINNIPEGSNVLLSFGEIDCRHYLPKLAKENCTSIFDEVEKMFFRYSDTLNILKDKFRLSIMGAYVCPDDHNHENKYSEILEAKYIFNSMLKTYCALELHCKRIRIIYIPLYEHSLNEGWDIVKHDYPHYFNDTSHLGACMIPVILDAISKHDL